MMNYNKASEQQQLLHSIGMIDFALVDMCLYLDTHPYDREGIEYFNHYNKIKNQLMNEYARKYAPLSLDSVDPSKCKEWNWALQPMPWEGVCY